MSAPQQQLTSIAATAGSSNPPAASNALTMVLGRIRELSAHVFKQQKPWSEVLDRNTLSKPANLSEAASRIRKNAAYFKVNYLMVLLATCVVTFVMHPSSLFVLGILLGGWIWLIFIRQAPLVIGGRTLSEREKLLGMSAISFITIFFLTSVGTVFFSALSFGLAVIALHGAFREPDNLFVDEAVDQQGFLGILTGTAAPTGPAAV